MKLSFNDFVRKSIQNSQKIGDDENFGLDSIDASLVFFFDGNIGYKKVNGEYRIEDLILYINSLEIDRYNNATRYTIDDIDHSKCGLMTNISNLPTSNVDGYWNNQLRLFWVQPDGVVYDENLDGMLAFVARFNRNQHPDIIDEMVEFFESRYVDPFLTEEDKDFMMKVKQFESM